MGDPHRNAHRAESITVSPAVAGGTDVQAALEGLAGDDATLAGLGLPDAISLAPTRGAGGSYQTVAADLNLDADAGRDIADGTAFLAGVMGNVLGDALTKDANYIAGVIGADSVTDAKAGEFQKGPVLGIVMDGVTDADGAFVAVIDGSDPSATTRANAAFAARMNNNDAGSGFDYGVDLYDPGRSSDAYTGGGEPLAIAKAIVRSPNQVCLLEGDGVPTSGASGTGDNFAGPGSLYIDFTNGNAYIQVGAITAPSWKLITRAA